MAAYDAIEDEISRPLLKIENPTPAAEFEAMNCSAGVILVPEIPNGNSSGDSDHRVATVKARDNARERVKLDDATEIIEK